MKAKEKAKELVDKMKDIVMDSTDVLKIQGTRRAKKCALIAVDEIILACEYNNVESHNTDWWEQVKNEINNL